MAEFFAMGGFGSFIWASYGLVFIALGALAVSSWRWAKSSAQKLDQLTASKNP